jgi:transcriptional regulator with XRE-family HTH domain
MIDTINQRIAALPDYHQTAVFAFLEFLEWKARIPTVRRGTEPADRTALGARLCEVRETLKQTEEQAASVAGLTLKTYQAYEQGRIGRWPTRKIIVYAETWNVSLDWLFDGTGTMFRDDKPPRIEIAPLVSNVIDWKAARARNGGDA